MMKRTTVSFMLAFVLLSTLATGVVASGAQAPVELTENYTWQPYGLSIAYNEAWTVTTKPHAISIHPADRDVSDGLGPELILFEIPGASNRNLNAALEQFMQSSNSTSGTVVPGLLDGRQTRSTSLTWADADATGGLMLIGEEDSLALGVAYIVRRSEASTYLPVFEAMVGSLTFEAPAATTRPTASGAHSSVSVASVQLPQQVAWDAAGLTLYFPAGWSVETEIGSFERSDSFIALPPDTLESSGTLQAIQGMLTDAYAVHNLHQLAEDLIQEYGSSAEVIDLTIAGYDAVAFDMLDANEAPPLMMRTVLMAQPDINATAIFVLTAEPDNWEQFLPIASAFISSIERMDIRASAVVPSGEGIALAAYHPFGTPDTLRQDGAPTQSFLWEEYGITFIMPEDWQTLGKGQNFDQALVSPELLDGGEGAFIMLQVFPSLGAGTTMTGALGSIAEQVGGEVEPFSVAGLEGAGINVNNDGEVNLFVLLPYGDDAAKLFIQTSAPPDDNATILDILDSMVIDPPKPDYAAVDAAWQTSLAEDGRLIYGDDDAPVTMIEFLSFTCGHCANYSLPIEHLLALEAETGRVRVEIALLAGDSLATLATQATLCATAQGKGYSAYHALFNGYLELGRAEAYSEEGVRNLLEPLGLDMDTLNACIEEDSYAGAIDQIRTDFLDYGLTGTPTVLLGNSGATADKRPNHSRSRTGKRGAGRSRLRCCARWSIT